jgi:ABC-type antimicrobial peptide transport system permease subunit
VAVVLLVVFAAVALTLAVVGIYSVTSYGVEQRGREIGVRMALGARRTDVLWLIVGGGMRQAAAGLALGLVVAGLLSHTLSSLLYAVAPLDARIFIVVAGTFGAVALLANGIPAWRAANPNAVHALWRG